MKPIFKLKRHLKKLGYIVEDEGVTEGIRWKKGHALAVYSYNEAGAIEHLINIVHNSSDLSCQGIHLRQADFRLVEDALEEAFKDNWEKTFKPCAKLRHCAPKSLML